MSKYSAQVNSAFKLIQRKGCAVTIHRVRCTNYDPMNPDLTPAAPLSSTNGVAVLLPASNGTLEAFDDRLGDDPNARRNFRFMILAGKNLAFKPEADDVILLPEGLARILGVTPLNPDGDADIIYNVGSTLDVQITLP